MHFSLLAGLLVVAAAPVDVLDLTWEAPTTCPAAADVRESIEGLVETVRHPQPTTVVAEVSAAEDDGWVLALRVESALVSSHRTLRAESCEELANATAMIAAIAIDPFATTADEPTKEPKPEPEPEPEPEPTPEPAPRTPPPAPERDTAPPTAGWSVGAGGGAAWSSSLVGVLRLVAGWERRRLGMRFGSDVWLPRRYEDGDITPRGVTVSHALGHWRMCFVPTWRRLAAPLCAGARAGGTIGRAFGVEAPRTRVSLALAALTSIGVRWSPSLSSPSVSLFLDAEPAVQLTRPRFHTNDRPAAFVGSFVSFSVVAGAAVQFGR